MLSALFTRLLGWASWPLLALLIILFLLGSQGFEARKRALKNDCFELHPNDERCAGELTLDSQFGYSKMDVGNLLDLIGEKGRRLYAITELSLDLAFPFVYGLLFATLVVRLFSHRSSWVLLFPLAAMTFDLLENATVALMASTYADKVPEYAGATSLFTSTKLILLLLSLLLVAVGAIRGLFRRRV